MKAAIISDIHANLPALEAVLKEAALFDIILCCGDMVGYYAEPNEVCDLIRSLGIPTVRGNHDAYVIEALTPKAEAAEAYRVDWTREALSGDNLRWLKSLPTEMKFDWDNVHLGIRHASPWDEETYLYPDSERLDEIRLDRNEILALGHTHRPLLRPAGEGFLINPGSVGQPRDYNPQACYAVIDTQTGNLRHHRVIYEVEAYQAKLRSQGWDTSVVDILSRISQKDTRAA